jgi:pimeloyl-ACP methyl ester carboxylesterase
VEFYSSLLEDLASHGYVVVGIDPTHIALVSEFPDGRVVQQDPELQVGEGFVATPLERGRQRANELLFRALLTTWSRVMADDASFVLDALGTWNREGGPGGMFAGRLALSRAGLFGHSMGGMATTHALVREPRFQAGVNLDGPLFGEPVLPQLKPLMILGVRGLAEQSPPLVQTYQRAEGHSWWVSIEGTGHMSFSDAGLLLAHFHGDEAARRGPFLGPIDPVRATHISREYLMAFFAQHLRDIPQLLLEGTPADYPEVRVHQRCGRATACANP